MAGGREETKAGTVRHSITMFTGAVLVVIGIGVGVLVATGNGALSPVRVSTAAPPTVVCGVTLSRAASGVTLYDITAAGFKRGLIVTAPTPGGGVFVQVAESCDHGSKVTITSVGVLRVIRAVWAADRLPIVLVLEALCPASVTLAARQQGRVVDVLRLDFPKAEISSP